ncbi:MAG: acetyl-CoA carboxylase carboxyltransferase subunit alpha [Planctomycetes bacterium]|nr:acetyl-CoA carboxylase carboxyltransferase subunit alpha [Planctomycetota bacterium]
MSAPPNLEFERPVLDLERKIQELIAFQEAKGVDLSETIEQLRAEQRRLARSIYANLTPWQEVLVARHRDRPSTMDFIGMIFTQFIELHGDRLFRNDGAVVCGFARLEGRRVLLIGHRKGKSTRESVACNWGLAHPEGYRKAMHKARLAERLGVPIIMFIDTAGAFPGVGAEERGVAQSIAENIADLSTLRVPILCVILGEGASGGALGIGVGDRILALQHSYFSVITPEGCAAILFRSSEKKEEAAAALHLTSQNMLELGIADEVVPEPELAAHYQPQEAAAALKAALIRHLDALLATPIEDLLDKRYAKYRCLGQFLGGDAQPAPQSQTPAS